MVAFATCRPGAAKLPEKRLTMATQDKAMLMNQVEGTLRSRMFANLLDEAINEINKHLDNYEVRHLGSGSSDSGDMLKAYIDAKQAEGKSEKTLTRYLYVIGRFLKAVKIPTREITTYHVRDYLSAELERGMKDSSVEGTREVLSAFFGWLDNEKMIPTNPLIHIAPVKVMKVVREAFSEQEIELIKQACTTARDLAIVTFLLSTGCRVSEVTNLNREDVQIELGECLVLGKGKKERVVYLNDVSKMCLRKYLNMRTDNNPALFIGRFGKRLEPNGIRVMLKKIEAESGVENVHPHRFRRTAITTLLNRGMAIQEVAIYAGHDKIDTTMRYFGVTRSRIKSSFIRYSA